MPIHTGQTLDVDILYINILTGNQKPQLNKSAQGQNFDKFSPEADGYSV